MSEDNNKDIQAAAFKASLVGPIVSSAHLSAKAAEMSEFEFGLIMASHAFNRWMVRCMAASGLPELGSLDILVLHSINHRERAKRVADICLVLNIEDTHTVSYALKKLVKLKVVSSEKRGKEALYRTTELGQQMCQRYREIREDCLLESVKALGFAPQDISNTGAFLRALSGIYDQAARAAASL
ncbi:winged helix DNA-binding protein [Balneatrix alpica]|uniref:Winged helix DNA-binding protein n=1 Tax=Balneatrix alpica TaxID=75684 RepID=A0ABV5ZD75_9GAMM|nr:winged helix DNA-binding protein [Balneatrix alpica]